MTRLLRLPLVLAALLLVGGPVLAQHKPGTPGTPGSTGAPGPAGAPASPGAQGSVRPPRTAGISAPPFAWWKSEPFKSELGLTTDQSARIDKIWETTRPELRQEWDELSRLEEKLSRLLQNDADEAALARQIDRVETARASANKTRSLMLVQMLKVLTPDQRDRFNTMHARWQDERQPRRPDSQRRPER